MVCFDPVETMSSASKAEFSFDGVQMAKCRELYFFFVAAWWDVMIGKCGFFHIHKSQEK